MKANKVSLLILMAALTGCGGGGSPATGMPTGATYINGNMGGGNQGGNTPTEPRQVELTEVVGSLDDAINDIYSYDQSNGASVASLGSFAVKNTNKRYDYYGNETEENLGTYLSDTSSNAYKYNYQGYIQGRSSSSDDTIEVPTETGAIITNLDDYGYNSYTSSLYNYETYPNAVKFTKNDNGTIVSLCTTDDSFCTNNAIQNPDGSFSAILVDRTNYDCDGNCNAGRSAYKVTFGSELSTIKSGEENNEHQDYTVWQVGKVDADGNFEPTRNGAYANLHINKNNYEIFNMRNGYMSNGQRWYSNKPDTIVTFEGKTNAVKVSTEKPNEDLTGNATLVVDFQGEQNNSNPSNTLTLNFDNWKKIDIINGYEAIVNGEHKNANTTIGFTGTNTGDDYNYNKATGIYRVKNVTDNDGIDVDVIGGFDAKAKDGLSIHINNAH